MNIKMFLIKSLESLFKVTANKKKLNQPVIGGINFKGYVILRRSKFIRFL